MSYFNDLKLTEAKRCFCRNAGRSCQFYACIFEPELFYGFFKSKTGMSPKHYAAAAKNNCNAKAVPAQIGMWLFIMLLFYPYDFLS